MKQSILFFSLIFVLVGTVHSEYQVLDLVPEDAVAMAWIKDVPKLMTELERTVQLEGIREMDAYTEVATFIQQLKPIVPMLIGLDLGEFIQIFGYQTALVVYDIDQEHPSAALLTDIRADPDKAMIAVQEVVTLLGSRSKFPSILDTYRGADFEQIAGQGNTIRFGQLDNVFVLGINGGFKRSVDCIRDVAGTITTNPRFQSMRADLGIDGQLIAYINAHRLSTLIGEDSQHSHAGLLATVDTVGVAFDVIGHQQKLVIETQNVDPESVDHLHQILFDTRPAMESSAWLGELGDIWLGANLGRPLDLLSALLPQICEKWAHLLDEGFGVDWTEELLSLLSGEISVTLDLPENGMDTTNPLDWGRLTPIVCLGLTDVSGFTTLVTRLADSLRDADLAQISVLERKEVYGQQVFRFMVSSDSLIPGLTLVPTVTIFQQQGGTGIVALSNASATIEAMLESIPDTPVDGRLMMRVLPRNVIQAVLLRELDERPEIPLEILGKITPVILLLETSPRMLQLSLISPETPWLTQYLHAAIAGVLLRDALSASVDQRSGEAQEKEAHETNSTLLTK